MLSKIVSGADPLDFLMMSRLHCAPQDESGPMDLKAGGTVAADAASSRPQGQSMKRASIETSPL